MTFLGTTVQALAYICGTSAAAQDASVQFQISRKLIPDIGIMVRVFVAGLGDQGSITDRVRPKTQTLVVDVALLNTQHYKVGIKGKVEQSSERSCALRYKLV